MSHERVYDEHDNIVWEQEHIDFLAPLVEKMRKLVMDNNMPLPYAINRLHKVYGHDKDDVSDAFVLFVRMYMKDDNKPLN